MKEYYDTKPEGYYRGQRPDLMRLIPKGTRSLLDVGCGEGGASFDAKQLFDLEFTAGIELFEDAAEKAREVLDEVLTINIEQTPLPYSDNKFDCILCADVLEHMIDPWASLRSLRRVLSPNGILIASIPNIANLHVVKKIIRDRFEYEENGILDKTHLRFFTLHTIKKMFADCGYEIVGIDRNLSRNFFMQFAYLWSFGYFKEGDTFQFLITARKDSKK